MQRLELDAERRRFLRARAAVEREKQGSGDQPLDLEAVIARVGEIKVSRSDYGDRFEAAIGYDPMESHFEMFINTRIAGADPRRDRFTIAHELGHYFILDHADALYSGKSPRYQYPTRIKDPRHAEALSEAEANYFAAHLLIPAAALRARLAQASAAGQSMGVDFISRVAQDFQTSFLCAASRCIEESPSACALICYPTLEFREPWVEVSHAFERQFGLGRNSRLVRVPPGRNAPKGGLACWFAEVIPSLKYHPVYAEVQRGPCGTWAFLGTESNLDNF